MATETAGGDPMAANPLDLPRERRLVCVEYPGGVRDVGKMLQTLGGEEGISRVSSRESPGQRGRDRAGLQPKGGARRRGDSLGNRERRVREASGRGSIPSRRVCAETQWILGHPVCPKLKRIYYSVLSYLILISRSQGD